jgi:hypothetical protein
MACHDGTVSTYATYFVLSSIVEKALAFPARAL